MIDDGEWTSSLVGGINRGDNAGLHIIYSGTVAGAREGAMRGNAVGVAASLNSYSRSADYSEAGRVTAELLTAIVATPGLKTALKGKVVNVNVPNLGKEDIKGVKLTQPGVSCTTADWVRVAGEDTATAAAAAATDAAFGDGIVELPIPLDGALEDTDWCKGKRWFRNKPGKGHFHVPRSPLTVHAPPTAFHSLAAFIIFADLFQFSTLSPPTNIRPACSALLNPTPASGVHTSQRWSIHH